MLTIKYTNTDLRLLKGILNNDITALSYHKYMALTNGKSKISFQDYFYLLKYCANSRKAALQTKPFNNTLKRNLLNHIATLEDHMKNHNSINNAAVFNSPILSMFPTLNNFKNDDVKKRKNEFLADSKLIYSTLNAWLEKVKTQVPVIFSEQTQERVDRQIKSYNQSHVKHYLKFENAFKFKIKGNETYFMNEKNELRKLHTANSILSPNTFINNFGKFDNLFVNLFTKKDNYTFVPKVSFKNDNVHTIGKTNNSRFVNLANNEGIANIKTFLIDELNVNINTQNEKTDMLDLINKSWALMDNSEKMNLLNYSVSSITTEVVNTYLNSLKANSLTEQTNTLFDALKNVKHFRDVVSYLYVNETDLNIKAQLEASIVTMQETAKLTLNPKNTFAFKQNKNLETLNSMQAIYTDLVDETKQPQAILKENNALRIAKMNAQRNFLETVCLNETIENSSKIKIVEGFANSRQRKLNQLTKNNVSSWYNEAEINNLNEEIAMIDEPVRAFLVNNNFETREISKVKTIETNPTFRLISEPVELINLQRHELAKNIAATKKNHNLQYDVLFAK